MSFSKSLIHYLVAEGLGRILPLLILPWIANALSVKDFGFYSLFQLYVMIGVVTIMMGSDQSVFRFIPGSSSEKERLWLSAGIIFTTVLGIFLLLIIAIISEFSDFSFFDSNISFAWYHLPLIIIFSALNTQFYTYLKAKQKSRYYMILFLLRLILFYMIFIIAIIYNAEEFSFIWAYYGAELFVFVFLLLSLKEKIGIPTRGYFQEMLKFGLPMFVITILGILIYQVDHYMIKIFWTVEDVGKYSFSYKYAAAAGSVILLINRVWLPRVYEFGQPYLEKTLRPVMIFSSLFYMLIFLTVFTLFQLLKGSHYLPASFHILQIFPLLGLGYFFFTGLQQLDAYLLLKKNTGTLSLFYIVVFIFNFLSNLWAIPRFGMTGAAITTLLSFFILWILLLSSFFKAGEYNKKLIPYLVDYAFLAIFGLLAVLYEKPLYCLILLLLIIPFFLKRIELDINYRELFRLNFEDAIKLKE